MNRFPHEVWPLKLCDPSGQRKEFERDENPNESRLRLEVNR